jgi:hypothetical protein
LVDSTVIAHDVNVVELIKTKRTSGVVHCGYLSDCDSLPAAASSFSLSPDPSNYREIAKTEALQILTRILHKDMAYNSELMPQSLAGELAGSFLHGFEDKSAQFFTNIDYSWEGRKLGEKTWAGPDWKPATSATFDAGVIAVAGNNAACLWVEDED